ncbi:hypothetical protein ABIC89_001032 [Variovorax boronicumulans]|uniref:hypothetical protein n=1 Tax=Variovorax boronicumulans TaxID=436515 RepID=UPI0033969FCA
MGDVIPLPRRAGAANEPTETASVLAGLMAQSASGEMQGSIHIASTKSGTEFHVLGTYADRLQVGVLALVKGLNFITDKIVATGNVGNTRSDAVSTSWEAPRRRLPRRLREVTKLGDLE